MTSLSQAVSAKAAEAVANVPNPNQGPFLTLLVSFHPDNNDDDNDDDDDEKCRLSTIQTLTGRVTSEEKR